MNKKNSPNIGHNKKSLLNSQVEHIDIKSFDARKIIDGMSKMSFSSRDTARAAAIYNEMLADKDCSIFLTLAGSTSAGGCMDLYTDLVKHNMVDAIVATGASIIDMDFFEALGFKHYQGSQFQDDTELETIILTGYMTLILMKRSFKHVTKLYVILLILLNLNHIPQGNLLKNLENI